MGGLWQIMGAISLGNRWWQLHRDLASKVEGRNYYTLKPSAIKNDGVIKFLILPLKNESLEKIFCEAQPICAHHFTYPKDCF